MSPPAWLDPSAEVLAVARPVVARAFVARHLDVLAAMDLDRARSIEVAAHAATETGWGALEIAHNAGGVKARERDAALYLLGHAQPQPWYRRAGHVASGDAPEVYYQGFDNTAAFWAFWLGRYVPRTGRAGERYTATGAAFWGAVPSAWFPALLLAGYRGAVREREVRALVDAGRDPGLHPSVRAHRACVARVRALAALGAVG